MATVSPALRIRLIGRDGGCTFPGCEAPQSWTESHHRIYWAAGGSTDEANLELLCVRRHHLLHEGGWEITIGDDPDRTPYFHPPDGAPALKGQRRPLIPEHRRR